MTSNAKRDITFGSVDLDDDEFAPRNTKIRITTLIDEDVLTRLKKIAASRNMPYQTLLNQVVRSFVSKPRKKARGLSEAKIRSIVRDELRMAKC